MFSNTGPFIPRADVMLRDFAQQFAEGVSKNPARYGLAQAEAASIMEDFVHFNEKYTIAVNPATRTRQTICDKDDARAQLKFTISNYAAYIRANKGITDGDKILIGVRPQNTSHKRRTCPSTQPLLNYIGSLPGVDQLVYHDSNRPSSKAKPYGAERLELWVAYTGPSTPKPTREDARPIGSFKKNKMLVMQDEKRDVRMGASGPATGMPTYWARWVGYDNKFGPWSLACRTSQAAQAMTAAGANVTSDSQAESDEDTQSLRMAA